MEVNFAKTLLQGRHYTELSDEEILSGSRSLLEGWMSGDHGMERPKLYDHYALLLVALIRKNAELEARIADLEGRVS
ncbi:hypothetical protein HNR42_000319 [Deinobacterium chartae]|uniref:Uncharacterized protein n=1 Tax=Deinobacterium chartae TaxID=521158 RepID=A0A841HU78_9DEIO|nr:hypothetical protein [Deinobacterium chartae]MBB6096907.1 hypothetical protein [Deinobacterium chartae]